MKLRSPLAAPTRANRALLPALLAGLLALAAVLQLALTGGDTQLPAPGWIGGGARVSLPQFGAGLVPPVLRRLTMFDPARSAAGPAGSVPPTGPLGGAVVAGSISVRGRAVAIIQLPSGKVGRLAVGGSLGGLRLVALEPDGAVFQSGAKRIRVPFGAPTITPAAAAGSEEESQ